MKKLVKVLILLVCVYVPFAQANTVPPSPTNSFYGDATGDMIIDSADIAQAKAWTLGLPYSYDTLQPQVSSQNWNTSDITSDILIDSGDISTLKRWTLGLGVTVLDKPWVLSNENLPTSGNPIGSPVAFQINLASTVGTAFGRAGIPVVARIDATGSTATGSLVGRTCTPIDGSRDQSSTAGDQCALSVTITDWYGAPGATKGLTETGTYGLKVIGNSPGNLRVVFSINSYPPGLDIPAISIAVVVGFSGPTNLAPEWSLVPANLSGIPIGSTYNVMDGVATDPDTGETLTCSNNGTSCTFPVTVGGSGPKPVNCNVEFTSNLTAQTCNLRIVVADDGSPVATVGSTISLTTVNYAPSFTTTGGTTARQGVQYSYAAATSDADEGENLTCSLGALNTCGGLLPADTPGVKPHTCPAFTFTPGAGLQTCQFRLVVTDNGVPAVTSGQTTTVTINRNPVITSTPFSPAMEGILYTYNVTATDPDLPPQALTCQKSVGDTCGGAFAGCSYSFTPPPGSAGSSCTVGVQVNDTLSGSAIQNTSINIVVPNHPPTVTLTCPGSVQETRDIVCTYTTSDPDVPIQGVTVVVNPATDTCGGSIAGGQYLAHTTEAQGPGSCVVGVVGTDSGVPPLQGTDQKTVGITEVNASPTLTLNCPASVGEGSNIVCNMVATDPDIPPNALNFTRHAADTCGGSIVGSTYTASTTESQGPGSCQVIVTVTDDGVPPRAVTKGSTVTINEINVPPTISINCPASVIANDPINCSITAGDTDIPANILTCSPALDDTCGGSTSGCSSYHLAAASSSCKVSVKVTDNGSPIMSANAASNVTVNPEQVDISCSDTNENAPVVCPIVTNLGGSPCTIGSGDTCGGSINSNCTGSYTAPAQGEAAGPGTCIAEVQKGATKDTNTVNILEVNENPSVAVDCPASVYENAAAVCNLTATDPDLPPQTLTCSLNPSTTCAGAIITGCTQVNIPAQGEGHTLPSCSVAVDVTDSMAGSGTGSDSITILEDNQPPSITMNCPAWVNEGSNISCIISTSDPDIPPNILTLSVDSAADTCGGGIAGSIYTAPATETMGGTNCIAGVKVIDNGIPPMSATTSATVAIHEINSPPSISLSCPIAVEYPNDIVCDFAMSDSDIPPNILTPFVDGLFDSCGGSIVGSQYIMPTNGVFWPPDSCTVAMGAIDDGVPPLDGYNQASVNIVPAGTNPPVLSWTLEPRYASDGVDNALYGDAGYGTDNAGLSGDSFNFRVLYTSDLISVPTEVVVAIDLNKDGDYTDPGEVTVLTCEGDCSSNDYSMGRIFKGSVVITQGSTAYAGTGELNYRFSAVDGLGRAATSGSPVNPKEVTVRNNVPELVILGKTALELEPTPGTAGLENVLSLFLEAERIEDIDAPGTPNNYPSYPSPRYPDGNYLDAKWGAAITDATLYAKIFETGLDWTHPEWNMEYWINTQFIPVADRIIARLDAMEAHPGFDTWSFRMNKSLRIVFTLSGVESEFHLGLRNSGGEWDGSEVYMVEAVARGTRALAEFLMAYGVRSIHAGQEWQDFLAMLMPEDDMMQFVTAWLSGTTPLPMPNGLDDDGDGIWDDMGAIGRIFSRFPEFGTYTGGPTGTELEKFRIDVIETISSLRKTVVFVTNETDDQSDDIWLIYRDCGLDGLCPGDPGYSGPDADGTEGNGVYDVVDSNGVLKNCALVPCFPDVDFGSNPGNFIPIGMTAAEPLEFNHNHAPYVAMMNGMTTALNGFLSKFGVPISIPYISEVNLIAWMNYDATNFEASFRGDVGLNWSHEIQGLFDIVNLVYPELGLQAPPGILGFFDNINIRDELARHWDFKNTFFPAYLPESGQKGWQFMGFVGDFGEPFDPVVLAPDGKACLYKIEPPIALETDSYGNPTGGYLLGFIDSNNNGKLDPFENLLEDVSGVPVHYLDLNNDGIWNGWTEMEHNTVPGTNGGIGFHNPVYLYFSPTFMQNTSLGGYTNDAYNTYIGLVFDFVDGIHLRSPTNQTPVAGSVLFDAPLVIINPTTALVSAGAGPVTIHVGGSDADGNPLVYSLAVGHGATITTSANVGHITWNTPLLPRAEPYVFLVTIYDGVSVITGVTYQQINIIVTP